MVWRWLQPLRSWCVIMFINFMLGCSIEQEDDGFITDHNFCEVNADDIVGGSISGEEQGIVGGGSYATLGQYAGTTDDEVALWGMQIGLRRRENTSSSLRLELRTPTTEAVVSIGLPAILPVIDEAGENFVSGALLGVSEIASSKISTTSTFVITKFSQPVITPANADLWLLAVSPESADGEPEVLAITGEGNQLFSASAADLWDERYETDWQFSFLGCEKGKPITLRNALDGANLPSTARP